MQSVTLSEQVPFRAHYDVIVVGGGAAGVAAALAARRQGKMVLLLEKSCMLGGLATLGLVVLYFPPLENKEGRRLIGGIAEDMLHLSIQYGYDNLPPQWTYRVDKAEGKGHYQTVFNAQAYALAMTELLQAEGVDILFDALFSAPVMEGKTCKGVVIDTKPGRYYYTADAFVDASGDADLFFRAGIPCRQKVENWLSYWAISTNLDRMQKAVESGDVGDAMHIENLGTWFDGHDNPEETPQYGMRTPEEVSDLVVQGQMLAVGRLHEFDRRRECFVTIPGMPQYRKTRAIQGLYTLDEKDRNQHFDDSIGCTAEDQRPQYCIEIPYRTLITDKADNIISAGRIISADGTPRDTTRLIAICSLTGEAAGIAAGKAADAQCTMAEVNVKEVQDIMVQNGNILHF